MLETYDDHGIRFNYPSDWTLETDDDVLRTTVSVHAPDGVAFALVAIDASRPDPTAMAEQALNAMTEEYPDVDIRPVLETIGGHRAVGHDIDFLALDVPNSCSIRCFRTDRRSVLIFNQWSDLETDEIAEQMRALRASIQETDEDG